MACKGKVATVVRRHCHNCTRAVSSQHIVAHPYRDTLFGQRIDGIGTGEYTAHLLYLSLTLTFGAVFGPSHIVLHLLALLGSGYLVYQLMFRAKHHKGDTKNSIGTSGENLETRHRLRVELRHIGLCTRQHIAIAFNIEREPHCGTLAPANPVALYFLQRVGPFHTLQSVYQPLGISRDSQAPLAHQLAFNRVAATHTQSIDNLVISQHCTQLGTPVDRDVGQIGQAVVHQYLLPLRLIPRIPLLRREVHRFGASQIQSFRALLGKHVNQLGNRTSLLALVAIVRVKQLNERPLSPLVIFRIAGANLTVPVETEAYFVQLLTVAGNVLLCRDGRMLTSLDGILLCRQAIGIVAHRVQHVVTTQTLVTRIDIACNIP